MRILAITNMYPTPEHPTLGVFVEQQVKGLRQTGLDVEVFLIERASTGVGAYVGVRQRIHERISAVDPDIVHVMYGGVIASATTRGRRQVPVVISFCGSDLLGSSSAPLVPRVAAAYGVWASHRAAIRADGIIVKSTNLLDALPANVNRSKVRVIPNGIDLERFRPAAQSECCRELAWRPDRFHVLFSSGAGNPCKRPELAEAAVRALRGLGVPAELHFLTGVVPEAVPLWLNASDALILTSLTEGSPNVVKEALACELPVVSVPVGDVGEQIQGIDGCYLCRPDPSDLAEKLSRVYTSRSRVVSRARLEELSLRRVAERIGGLYRDVLTSHGRERNTSSRKTTARDAGDNAHVTLR